MTQHQSIGKEHSKAEGSGSPVSELSNFAPMFPGLAWRPMLDLTSSCGSNLSCTMSALSGEWVNFLQRRFRQDVAFYEKLAACKQPEEAYATCADFYLKAMQDYPQEFLRIARITSEFAGSSAETAYRCMDFQCDERQAAERGSIPANRNQVK